ncbi:MATE family efflux transporter [Syntrophus aciditrophicus]|uniref:Multidrug export protein MepA n=1 Tax=Syntrophus aciditrophicus (strain SB) TaxID=56780 RepID=Q2LV55_SYNAS|nr:MATE family efflux transporter [Syntrophus aciditrophicus]ABC77961.1 Na+ driven multidrug efflux pump [Syntrophus aciditrophicus SB]OPY15795.1 MAG: Multidrug export protein MepA [Syntrophus sp. PtaB.Bin075]
MTDKALNLGKGPILPLLLKMSGPSIATVLVVNLYSLIDAFWLARLSPNALAALTIIFPIQLILGGVGVGTGLGAGSYAARMFGAGENRKARQTAGQVFFLSAVLGTLFIGAVLTGPEHILRFLGATTEIIPLSRQYLLTLLPGVPFLFLIMMTSNLLRAEGRPHLVMYSALLFSAVSCILDPFLIFGWGPFPRLEIRGAAAAAVISQIAGALLAAYYLQQKSSKYKLKWHYLRPDYRIIWSIYQTGFPSIIINLAVSLGMLLHNHILGGYSYLAVATLGIVSRVNGLVMIALYGIGHGLMPMVAYSEGANLRSRLKETVKIAVKISFGIALLCLLIVEVFAPAIAALFSDGSELRNLTATALRINILILITAAPSLMWINMFIGLGQGKTAMVLLVGRETLILIPLLWLLPSSFGINGVWMAQPLANALSFLFILYWTKRQFRIFDSQISGEA